MTLGPRNLRRFHNSRRIVSNPWSWSNEYKRHRHGYEAQSYSLQAVLSFRSQSCSYTMHLSFPIALVTIIRCTSACIQHLQSEAANPTDLVRRSAPQPLSKASIDKVRIFDGQRMSKPRNITIDGMYISDCIENVTQRIDASGKYLLPGLIESHAHPSSIQSLGDFTAYGVTTVMNMACKNYTLCASMKNVTGLADFYTAGVPAQGPNSSHAINMHTPADRLVYPDSDPAQLIDWAFGNHSDYYKITVEINGPTQELQNGLVKAAHAIEKQTMSHAADITSYNQSIRSGTDGIQHIPSDGLLSQDEINALKVLPRTYITPTMTIFTYYFKNPQFAEVVGGSAVTGANASYQTFSLMSGPCIEQGSRLSPVQTPSEC